MLIMKTSKLFLTLILFISVLTHLSCKKNDTVVPTKKIDLNLIEQKFFNTNRTTNATENAFISFLKKVNDTNHFVEKTVKQIGFPKWDKAITTSKRKNFNSNNVIGDSSQTFFIPFVRDSQNYVNASMVINLTPTDTSFFYRCDWEYRLLQNDGAESLATFFMSLDKVVFNHKKFKIIDSSLFESSHGNALFIRLDTVGSNYTPSNNYWELELMCDWVYTYYVACGFPNSPQCINGCDACYRCIGFYSTRVCWEEWVWNGGGGTPGGNTGGGNPGGGGSTPPPCDVVPIGLMGRVVDPCDQGPGWEPIPIDPAPTTLEILTAKLDLNTTEISWLHNNSIFANEITDFLINAQSAENPATNLPYTYENPEALLVAKSTLQAAMAGIVQTGFNQTNFNILISNLPSPYNQTSMDPMWPFYFAMECINIKAEHPNWSNARVYLEASLEVVHIMLDVAGVVPVVGEVADLANGGIYTLQGDGVNATLSFASAIPIGGWAVTAAKYAKIMIIAADGSRRTLKWAKNANNIISFGKRGLLRDVLGLAVGDPRKAHHLVPWEHCEKGIIQKAAGSDFHMNEILNGIPLTTVQHNGSHWLYNQKVGTKLQNLLDQATALNWNNAKCATEVRNLTNNIKNWIISHPNESINNIIIP